MGNAINKNPALLSCLSQLQKLRRRLKTIHQQKTIPWPAISGDIGCTHNTKNAFRVPVQVVQRIAQYTAESKTSFRLSAAATATSS